MNSLSGIVPEYIKSFEAYIPSMPDEELKRLFGCPFIYRLNNNENPLGPPEQSKRILRGVKPEQASIYPSGDAYFLREKLAEKFNILRDQIIVGNGANELITFVIKAFCEQGDNIITADGTFAVYEWVATFSGIEVRIRALRNFCFDRDAILDAIDRRTKVIFICNPNNPTGTYWNNETLTDFLRDINGRCIVVVDEAYGEYVEAEDFPDTIGLIDRFPNLLSFRTFSKIYGLAGLRVGYLTGSKEVVDILKKTCVVYSVNTIAQECALAALEDNLHIERSRLHVRREKDYMLSELRKIGMPIQSAEGCFIMIKLPISDTYAYRKFLHRGIMIRSMTGFRFPNWIRVSIGLHEANEAFLGALREIKGTSKEAIL